MAIRYCQLARRPGTGNRNIGDALIHHSARQLLREVKGPVEVMVRPQSEALTDDLDEVNGCRAVLTLPPLRDDTWPNVVRLTDDLDDLTVPVVGLGAAGKRPAQSLREAADFGPDEGTSRLLDRIAADVGVVACRDAFTQWELANAGYHTTLVGDCAFYDPELIGTAPTKPREVRRVAFTAPRSGHLVGEAAAMLAMIRATLPDAEVRVVRHGLPNAAEARVEGRAGLPVVDVSGDDIDRLAAAYDDVDLYVGYRVHGHLWRMRTRRPSILVEEDSRAVGFNATLGQVGVPTRRRSGRAGLAPKVVSRVRRLRRSPAVEFARREIMRQVATGFESVDVASHLIDGYYEDRMLPYLKAIP